MRKTIWLAAIVASTCGCGEAAGVETSGDAGSTSSQGGAGAGGGSGQGGTTGEGGDEDDGASDVNVMVTDQLRQPLADVPIVVHAEDGAVVETTETTGDGAALLQVPTGGSVSAFVAHGQLFAIQTIVEPPAATTAAFTFDVPAPSVEPSKVTTYDIAVTAYPMLKTKEVLTLLDGMCATTQTMPGEKITLNDEGCADKQQHWAFVLAMDADNEIVAWASIPLGVAPGGTVSTSVAINQTAFSGATQQIQNVPQPARSVRVGRFVANGSPWVGQSKAEQPYDAPTYSAFVMAPAPKDYNTCVGGAVEIGTSDAGSSVSRSLCDDPAPDAWSFDAGAAGWIYLTGLDLTDAAHPAVTWSAVPGLAPSYVDLRMGWSLGSAWVVQRVLLPPDRAPGWRLGDLPGDLASFRPVDTSGFQLLSLHYRWSDMISGYADAVDGLQDYQLGGTGAWSSSWLVPQQ